MRIFYTEIKAQIHRNNLTSHSARKSTNTTQVSTQIQLKSEQFPSCCVNLSSLADGDKQLVELIN